MKVIVFGSTGRVGTFALEYALAAGHQVTAFARDKSKVKINHPNLSVIEGDTYKPDTVLYALKQGFDAVIMAVGTSPFKSSTVVRDSTKIIVDAMKQTGHKRYLAVSGVTLMKKNFIGAIFALAVNRIIKIAEDHKQAFDYVKTAELDWVIVACPHIANGKHKGIYQIRTDYFPGGYKRISPQDVADFIVKELKEQHFHQEIVGIWY